MVYTLIDHRNDVIECPKLKWNQEPQASPSLMFLPHFDVLCDLLLNRPTATWNLFVLYNDQNRK